MMQLLAKGKQRDEAGPPATITQHTSTVFDVAVEIWRCIEADLADALTWDRDELRASILAPFLLAATMHDVGKANSAFQALVKGRGGVRGRKRQPVRHEVLAGVLITEPRFLGPWAARSLNEPEHWGVAWAVAGHHREVRGKRPGESEDPMYRTGGVPPRVTLHLANSQVREVLEKAREVLKEHCTDPGTPPCICDQDFDTLDESQTGLATAVRTFARDSCRIWRKYRRHPVYRKKIALVKALLIAADVAGSALPSTKKPVREWVHSALSRRLEPADLGPVVEHNLEGRVPYPFQTNVASSETPVTIVTAGCGNGKTTAAYLWAQKWAKGRKLFFTYPTTGTASAGFADYLFTQTHLERELIHSRSEVDLQAMADSADTPAVERAQRLESVNAWDQQVIACTVDSVLGLMQNQRRPLFAFPAIASGAFVFDEVHSYDRRLFGELLRFLKTFPGLPALIMSASIPPNRLDALREAAAGRVNETPIPGDPELERAKRYTIEEHEIEQCWAAVEGLLCGPQSGDAPKVLWVCNTVRTAIDVCREAADRLPGVERLLYHSRYRYKDRVGRQLAVIEEFRHADRGKTARKHHRPAFAVTTQVCEMSLDISADLLVSALCPLPSLVQRLGRLNRYTREDDPKPAYVYPFRGRPYHEEEHPAQMEAAATMIRNLAGRPCGQRDLAGALDEMQSNEDWSEPVYSAWLDGGWQTTPLPARDGDNSITVVREEDLCGIERPWTTKAIVPWTIPMLFRRGFTWEQRACGYPIAQSGSIHYDEEGASWADSKTD